MKTVKKLFAFLTTAALLLFAAAPAFAAESENEPDYSSLDYYISSFDVQIDVSEDNVLNVTEKISAYFNIPSHGIYRYIPLSNDIKRADGTEGKTKAKIKNLKVSEFSDTSRKNGNYVIRIGSEYKEITGAKDYTISYSYIMGRDIGNGFDELYFNIIGEGWKTYIQNASFSINMPKEFDESKLGFSAGSHGAVDSGGIEYSVSGNKINGRLTKELAPNQALTVRIELPENYFRFDYESFYKTLALEALIPAAVFLAVFLLWLKYGKDKKIVKRAVYNPPDGMSSLDVAFWYKGYVENSDVVPLLFELANEGFIEIIQRRSGLPDYIIHKLKKYDGDDESKKIFFKGLFWDGGDVTPLKTLKNNFHSYITDIVENRNSDENKKEVFREASLILRAFCWLGCVLSVAASLFAASRIIGGYEKVVAAVIGIAFALGAFALSFFMRKRTEKGHEMLEKITGFKSFLENSEKKKLEELVNDNPSFYYDILPYAYVLGVSDVWTKNFESITDIFPSAYGGLSEFDRAAFYSVFNHLMHSTAAVASAPHSGAGGSVSGSVSGGGFSGGGISGGGSGGGGGGRW